MKPTRTPFQTHLLFFATPSTPPRLTVHSALRASLTLGLSLPVSLLLALALRLLYAPRPNPFAAVHIDRIPRAAHRSQLEGAVLPPGKTAYSCAELLGVWRGLEGEGGGGSGKGWVARKIDQGHILGFWSMAASRARGCVASEDVERFQGGRWEEGVAKRRRRGRADVVPFWRGGPVWVTGHSWAAWWLFGVRVYEEER